ncbi:GNAT family N-acetyltransferase [Deefgea sp. CFH1-16]|uniref:GNAT family N-acetyltransferase n=1 Tax=Deefgea sp. CFH1-16 TaxID=2675457 RepID=UPI0015F71EC8|nr:GNAT family N-acetyltransferase [Deefgea sp. CFH1-16]MBM5573265.1 GNAT family N-acetyltransferase [Deefgea sp. CFH1-16]
MQTLFRIAVELDAEAIAQLVNRAYRPRSIAKGWTHEAALISGDRTNCEQIKKLFQPQSAILLLCEDTEIVACVHVERRDEAAYIGMLSTDPLCQAQGIGKQMLTSAEQYAVANFKSDVLKISVLSSRPELQAFYERRGYLLSGHVEDYPVAAGVGQPKVNGLHVVGMEKRCN